MSRSPTTRRTPSGREESPGAEGLPGPEFQDLGPRVWILGSLMLLVGAVTAILIFRGFRSESYLYLAFYSVPANTAVSLFPHEPILVYFGKFADVWLAAGAATAGTIAAGYMDHAVFVPLLNLRGLQGYKRKELYRRAIGWYTRYPFATLVVAGFSPIPFFPFKFLSFSVGYPLGRYLLALTVARFPRYLLLAWIGVIFDIPDWILIGIFLVIIVLYAVKAGPELYRRWRRRRRSRSAEPGAVPGREARRLPGDVGALEGAEDGRTPRTGRRR